MLNVTPTLSRPSSDTYQGTTEDFNTTSRDNTVAPELTTHAYPQEVTSFTDEITTDVYTTAVNRRRRAAEETVTSGDVGFENTSTVSSLEIDGNHTEFNNITTQEPTTQTQIAPIPVFEPKCPVNKTGCVSCRQPVEPRGFDGKSC